MASEYPPGDFRNPEANPALRREQRRASRGTVANFIADVPPQWIMLGAIFGIKAYMKKRGPK